MQLRNDPPETGNRIDEQVLRRLRFTGPPVEMSFAINHAAHFDRAKGACHTHSGRSLPGERILGYLATLYHEQGRRMHNQTLKRDAEV